MLREVLKSIGPLDEKVMEAVQKRLDSLTKPLGSLGRLEAVVKQMAGVTGNPYPEADRRTIVVMCADNGVVEEGVSQTGKEVTASVVHNFSRGITAINVLSKHSSADLLAVDIGIDSDDLFTGVLDKKIRRGTWNIAKGPAMTREEAIRGIETGVEIVESLKSQGTQLLGTGEMGIGNTTTSCAVASFLTGAAVEKMAGRGAGLSDEGLKRKIETVRRAIVTNRPDKRDAIDVLARLGGFDLAGLAGCYIGAAFCRLPVVLDGFITAAAALVAARIEPSVINYILPSHGSAEPGNAIILEELGLSPYLSLEMRLGEGTGAALAFHIIGAALEAYKKMGTFPEAGIEQYVPQL